MSVLCASYTSIDMIYKVLFLENKGVWTTYKIITDMAHHNLNNIKPFRVHMNQSTNKCLEFSWQRNNVQSHEMKILGLRKTVKI